MNSFQFSWIVQMTFLLLQGKNMFNDFTPEIKKEKIQDWEFGCCKKCKLRTFDEKIQRALCSKYNMFAYTDFVCKSFTPIKQEEFKTLCQK